MQVETGGKTFREAWIAGVKKHYPGEPMPSYISPWTHMPEWERQSAAAVYDQVRHLIEISDGAASKSLPITCHDRGSSRSTEST